MPRSELQSRGILVIKVVVVSLLIAWLFFDSALGLVCIGAIGPLFYLDWKREQRRKQQYQIELQFQTGLVFAAGALEAGYSVENAWKEMETEITRLYGQGAVFATVLRQMNRRVGINEPLEKLVLEMGMQSETEMIREFSDVFYFARRSGGNMTKIMRRTANLIHQRFQIQEEIQLMLASRELELLILHVMPIAVLGYLRFGSSAFLEPLYHNLVGVSIMVACLAIYGVAWWLSRKIIQIGV